MNSRLSRIRYVVIDLDGTVYRGEQLFSATLRFLERLGCLEIRHSFLTNNTSKSKGDYVRKLRSLGISVQEQDIATAADSVISHMRFYYPGVRRVAILGTPSLCLQIEEAGFDADWQNPEAVIVGFDTTLTYDRLCRAAYWISTGIPYIATHPDRVCPSERGTVLVDCGSICACLSAATGRTPTFLGKPDPAILLELSKRFQLGPEQIAVVGDRLYTDILMAQRAGVMAVLVLTGEAKTDDVSMLSKPPDLVVSDLGEFGEWLERARVPGMVQ